MKIDKLQKQLKLEEEMVGMGVKRFRDSVNASKEKGQEATTPYGSRLISEVIEPLSTAIAEWIADAKVKPRKLATAVKYLDGCNLDIVAFITAKGVINAISKQNPMVATCLGIAGGLEDQLRFERFQNQNPGLWHVLKKDLTRVHASRRRTILIHSMGKADIEWDRWLKSDRVHVGMLLIRLFIETTGVAKIVTIKKRSKTIDYLQADKDTLEWIAKDSEMKEVLCPFHLPMIIEPKPWTTPTDGGYVSPAIELNLIKTSNSNYIEEMSNMVSSMPQVYSAINTLQDTPWMVNGRVLEVMEEIWDQGWSVGKMPTRNNLELPPKPHDIATNREALIKWKREASKVHVHNAKKESRRIQQQRLLFVANKFKTEKEIFFPYQLDFRGRVYAVPNFLNPQGCDLSKSLLTFANGKPVEDETAIKWLAVHGANLYGEDKVSFTDRQQWVNDNQEAIVSTATDPISTVSFWGEADKPWQFLAWCLEWAEFVRCHQAGEEFISRMPIALDGSCNGLQNFSAMLRDKVGGSAVNLIPSETPEDIYQEVADVVINKLRASENPFAQLWLNFGISRKTTKRSVMVLPYGGTRYSCRDFVQEYFEDQIESGNENPFSDDDFFKATIFLSNLIWDSIGEVVLSAGEAMDWLQSVARIVSKEGLPISWTTPTGFVVFQNYTDFKSKLIETKLGERAVKRLTLRERVDKINSRKQIQGVSPNFVHSMDASALMLSVNKAKESGITNFCMIHDSYGTLASDTEALAQSLRVAFVEMYQNDVLEIFMNEVTQVLPEERLGDIPAIPEKGDLVLEDVLKSDYFFA